jgi:hypothetical protein
MTTRFRPVHTGFDSLRQAGFGRSSNGYHQFGSAAIDQMAARASVQQVRVTRPSAVFADFSAR